MFNSNQKDSYYRQRGIPSQMTCSALAKQKPLTHHALSNLNQIDYICEKVLRITEMQEKAESQNPHQEKELFQMKSELAFTQQMIDDSQKVNENLSKNLQERTRNLQCFQEQVRFRIQEDKRKNSLLKLQSFRNPLFINSLKKYQPSKEEKCQNSVIKQEIHEEDKEEKKSDRDHELLIKQYEALKKQIKLSQQTIEQFKKEKKELKMISHENNIKNLQKICKLENQISAIKSSKINENPQEKNQQDYNCKEEMKNIESEENSDFSQNFQSIKKLSEFIKICYFSEKIELQELELLKLKQQKDKRDETKQLILKNLQDERETNKLLANKLSFFESENELLRSKLKENSQTDVMNDQQPNSNSKSSISHEQEQTILERLNSNSIQHLSKSQSESEKERKQMN